MKPASLVLVAISALSSVAYGQSCADMQDIRGGGIFGVSEALAVSAGGDVVVGWGHSIAANETRPFRWTSATGIQDLGSLGGDSSLAHDVSSDGSVVVGHSSDTFGFNRPFRWTASTGLVDLGSLGQWAAAYGVSGGGGVVVGETGTFSNQTRAFRWTNATGIQDLGTLGGATSGARDTSSDGTVVVGWSTTTAGETHAFRWVSGSGMQDLGRVGEYSWAESVSADGATVVGGWTDTQGIEHAFRWTAAGGLEDIGNLGGDYARSLDVSADGSVIVGRARTSLPSTRAFRWTASDGMQDLGTLDPAHPGAIAFGVSADGTYIVGRSGGDVPFRMRVSALGWSYCRPAVSNSSGCGGFIFAAGNASAAANDVTLHAHLLPPSSFGFFLTSRDRGNTFPVNNSQGRLCLGGFIGRYVGPGQVLNSGTTGAFSLQVNLGSMPQPFGSVAAQPGETWSFQAWHRDANPTTTSNFTDAVSVTFN